MYKNFCTFLVHENIEICIEKRHYHLFGVNSPVVIIALTEVFDGTVPSNILFPFP